MHDESASADRGDSERGSVTPEALPQVTAPDTVPLSDSHRVGDFRCAKNPRINDFFKGPCERLLGRRYCRVFILPDPDDAGHVWGFYTLSPSVIPRTRMTRSDKDNAIFPLVPMMLIGYMGRDDSAAGRSIGSILVADAARRIYRNPDLAAVGIMLDSDGGPNNKKLWDWYQAQGFKPAKDDPNEPKNPDRGVMYAALESLITELKLPK